MISDYTLSLLFIPERILSIASEVSYVGRHSHGKAYQLIISKIDDLKEFYIETKQDLDKDIQALKESHEQLSVTLETYALNHCGHNKKERKSILKLTCIIAIAAILIATSGVADVIIPYLMKLTSLLF